MLAGFVIKGLFQSIKPVLANNYVAVYKISTIITNTIPLILIYILFYYLLRNPLNLPEIKSNIFSLLLIWGTLLISYSKYLTNHIFESLLQLFLFLILIRFKSNKLICILIGILLSAIFAVDITNGIITVPVTVLWLTHYKKVKLSDLIWIFLGALPLLFTHFYLSYIQFGDLLPPQLFPETYLSYEGSKWIGSTQGFEALNHPIPIRLFNYTFGTHGLFLYQPILLIPFLIKKNWKNPLWIYTAAIVLGYILFNTIMQKNYAGSAFGPRRFLPLIPIIYFFVVKNLSEYWSDFNFAKKVLIILSFIATVSISYLGYTNPWNNYYAKFNSQKIYFPILYTIQNK